MFNTNTIQAYKNRKRKLRTYSQLLVLVTKFPMPPLHSSENAIQWNDTLQLAKSRGHNV